MKVDEGDKIKRGQRIAEWDPYTRPILTEVEGTVAFEDLVEGQSMSETLDESTGIAKRVVIDWRTSSRGSGPASGDRHQGQGRQGPEARARRRGALPARGRRDHLGRSGRQREGGRRHRAYPDRKRQDARHHRRSAAGGGAVRGAPAEGGRDHRRDLRHGAVRQGLQEQAPASRIEPTEKGVEPAEYLIPKGKHIHLQDGDVDREGRLHRRRQSRRRTTSWRSRASRSSRTTSSTRSRRSTGCRAWRSTTSTSR